MLLWKVLSGCVYNLVLTTTEVIIIFQHDGQLIYKLQKDSILNVIVKMLSGSIYELVYNHLESTPKSIDTRT